MNDESTCVLCGKALSRYGNKKIKDGVLCRNCIKAASSWLNDDDYERLGLEEYKEHLAYREKNKELLKTFKADKKVEGKYSLYLDEEKEEFLISKRKDYVKDNADVISYADIDEISIFEEKYMDTEDVDICFDMKLNNPQIDNIYFRVNEFPGLVKGSEEHTAALDLAFDYLDAFEQQESIDFEQKEGE